MARFSTEGGDNRRSGLSPTAFLRVACKSLNLPLKKLAGLPDQFSSLNFDLAIQDDAGYSEAVVSIQAFKLLVKNQLNAQEVNQVFWLVGGELGEGSRPRVT